MVFSGVAELIQGLAERGMPWGVVTNKSMRFTRPLTQGMPLFATARAIVGGDSTPRAKPFPDPLYEAARQLGLAPEDCLYVGDDERDVAAGKAAGMPTVAATYGYLGKSDVAETVLTRAAEAVAAHPEPDPIFEAFLASARCALAAVTPIRGKWRLEMAFVDGQRCAAMLGAVGAVHGQMVAEHYLAIAATHLGLYEDAVRACRTSVAGSSGDSRKVKLTAPSSLTARSRIMPADSRSLSSRGLRMRARAAATWACSGSAIRRTPRA